MNYRMLRIFPFIAFFFAHIGFSSESDSLQKAITTKVAPFYSEPNIDLLPKGYVKKGDTNTIHFVSIDSLGNPWFQLVEKDFQVWSPAKFWQYIALIDTVAFLEGRQNEKEKRRRLRILREHRDWPRRIIRTVRFGRICLDMTTQHLAASWGDPTQKSNAFTVGLGIHSVWIYSEEAGSKITVVIIKNNSVIGWTSK